MTMMFRKISRSPQVVRCAPKLGFEGRWLRSKVVLSTCRDEADLQNVFRRRSLSPHSQAVAGGVCSVLYGVGMEHRQLLSPKFPHAGGVCSVLYTGDRYGIGLTFEF
jgi:hypothetical protein